MTSADWVVFDWGGVISRWTTAIGDLAELMGARPAEFEAAYWLHRERYDGGLSDLEYWRAVGASLGRPVDEPLVDRLWDTDVTGWLGTDPGTVEVIGSLAAGGARLALLSNAPGSFRPVVERQPWAKAFEVLLFSGGLRMMKPEPAIWATLCERLGAAPESCLLVDDMQANVDGAEAAGLRGVRFTGADALHRDLQRRGLF